MAILNTFSYVHEPYIPQLMNERKRNLLEMASLLTHGHFYRNPPYDS